MTKYILHIIYLLPFVVLAQQKEVLHKEYFKDGSTEHEWYTINNHPVKQWKTYYKDSTSHYQRNYNNTGKITSEGWYLNQLKNGYHIEYFKDSCIGKGHYQHQLKEKSWQYYTKNHLDSVGNYNANKPVDNWLYYHNGVLVTEKTYLKAPGNYQVAYYHPNGIIKAQGTIQNQQKNGYWKYYSKQNILISCGTFKNDLKEGYWHFYSDQGVLLQQGDFIKNKKSKWWSFFTESGNLSHKCELKENKLNGYCMYYQDNKIVKGRYFKKGVKVKEWNDWRSFKKDYKKPND